MISDRARELLSEGVSEDEEKTVIFLEKGDESSYSGCFGPGKVTKTRRSRPPDGWSGPGVCAGPLTENLRTGMIRSKDGERFIVAVSGREIEAKEWPPEFDDSSPLSAGQTAR